MLLNPLTIHLPKTTQEAAKLYKELDDVKVLAGGTFLLNSLKLLKKKGTKTAKNILSLAKVNELKKISIENDVLTIGAMATVNELYDFPGLKDNWALLKTVCRNISTNPIRNMATIGGNLTCRYTWTEMGAVMIALNAKMFFMAPDGSVETILPEDFFANAARSEKIFTHVTIERNPSMKWAYRRVKKSLSVDVPLLAVCITSFIQDKKWVKSRVAINNGSAFAQRDKGLEDFLNTSVSSLDLGQKSLEYLTSSIYDVRSSEYKQHMFRVSIKSALEEMAQ